MFALELQRRLTAAGSRVRSLAAHPGLSSTSLLDHSRTFSARMMSLVGQDVERGALPTLYAATQDLPGGTYVGPNGFRHLRGYPETARPSKAARDPELGRGLWELSERLVARRAG